MVGNTGSKGSFFIDDILSGAAGRASGTSSAGDTDRSEVRRTAFRRFGALTGSLISALRSDPVFIPKEGPSCNERCNSNEGTSLKEEELQTSATRINSFCPTRSQTQKPCLKDVRIVGNNLLQVRTTAKTSGTLEKVLKSKFETSWDVIELNNDTRNKTPDGETLIRNARDHEGQDHTHCDENTTPSSPNKRDTKTHIIQEKCIDHAHAETVPAQLEPRVMLGALPGALTASLPGLQPPLPGPQAALFPGLLLRPNIPLLPGSPIAPFPLGLPGAHSFPVGGASSPRIRLAIAAEDSKRETVTTAGEADGQSCSAACFTTHFPRLQPGLETHYGPGSFGFTSKREYRAVSGWTYTTETILFVSANIWTVPHAERQTGEMHALRKERT